MTMLFDKFQDKLAQVMASKQGSLLWHHDDDDDYNGGDIDSLQSWRLLLKIQRIKLYCSVFGIRVSVKLAIQSLLGFVVAKLLVVALDAVEHEST